MTMKASARQRVTDRGTVYRNSDASVRPCNAVQPHADRTTGSRADASVPVPRAVPWLGKRKRKPGGRGPTGATSASWACYAYGQFYSALYS